MIALPEVPERIRAWVGQSFDEEQCPFEIERGYIASSCASVENANPLYWDDALARAITGGPIAPPAMLSVWMRPHHWEPGRSEPHLPLSVHFRLKRELDFPEAIITGNEIAFGEPVRPGDALRTRQTLRSISEPKTNRLGTGRYWVIDLEYRNQRDEWVGTESYTCFGYRREA